MIVGADYPEILFQRQSIEGKPSIPFAAETLFGWTLCGGRKEPTKHRLYKTDTTKDQQIINILAQDYSDCDDYKMSQDDLKFREILEDGVSQNSEGRCVLPLPLKNTVNLLRTKKDTG